MCNTMLVHNARNHSCALFSAPSLSLRDSVIVPTILCHCPYGTLSLSLRYFVIAPEVLPHRVFCQCSCGTNKQSCVVFIEHTNQFLVKIFISSPKMLHQTRTSKIIFNSFHIQIVTQQTKRMEMGEVGRSNTNCHDFHITAV